MGLNKLLVVGSHDLQRNNLGSSSDYVTKHRQTNLLPERAQLRLLLLLLGTEVLDVLYALLQDRGLAHFVPGGVRLLAVRHQLLQRVVTLLDGVPPLLLGGSVSLTPS